MFAAAATMCSPVPSNNQASLRDEFARLRDEFGTLSSAGKVTPESAVLMGAVFVLLELMVAICLEKTTRKSSKNSSNCSYFSRLNRG